VPGSGVDDDPRANAPSNQGAQESVRHPACRPAAAIVKLRGAVRRAPYLEGMSAIVHALPARYFGPARILAARFNFPAALLSACVQNQPRTAYCATGARRASVAMGLPPHGRRPQSRFGDDIQRRNRF